MSIRCANILQLHCVHKEQMTFVIQIHTLTGRNTVVIRDAPVGEKSGFWEF